MIQTQKYLENYNNRGVIRRYIYIIILLVMPGFQFEMLSFLDSLEENIPSK